MKPVITGLSLSHNILHVSFFLERMQAFVTANQTPSSQMIKILSIIDALKYF